MQAQLEHFRCCKFYNFGLGTNTYMQYVIYDYGNENQTDKNGKMKNKEHFTGTVE